MSGEAVYLQRPDETVPWGFRLFGGRDCGQPLAVQKVTPGSVAATGLQAGDVILQIGDSDTSALTHAQSMQTIKGSGNLLQLVVARGAAAGTLSQCPPTPATPQTGSIRNEQPPLFNNATNGDPYSYGAPQYGGSQAPSSSSNGYGGQGVVNGGDYGQNNTQDSYGYSPQQFGRQSSYQQHQQQQQQQPAQMPDAVLNMAARGPPEKKPFAYVADVNDIKEQRDRVRKKQPTSTMPRYQQMLNLPQFDDSPRPRGGVRSTPATPPPPSDTAVIQNLQFNSPIGMYTDDNVMEAFRGQVGSSPSQVVGLKKKEKEDITQSPVYKMIHGIDQPKAKPAILYAEARDSPLKGRGYEQQQPEEDNRRLAGLNKPAGVPSKSFQMLQQSVGDSGVDTRPRGYALAVDEPGEYDQQSIRYTGRNIPSKSFQRLQNMTAAPQAAPQGPKTPDAEAQDDGSVGFGGLRHVTPRNLQDTQYQDPNEPRGGSEIDTSSIRQNLGLRPVAKGTSVSFLMITVFLFMLAVYLLALSTPAVYAFTVRQQASAPRTPDREPDADDETRFSGLRHVTTKNLQDLQINDGGEPRGGSEIDTSSIYHNLRPVDGGANNVDGGVGEYDEKSIRYTGRTIPSKSFARLQNMTGGPDPGTGSPGSGSPATRRQLRGRQPSGGGVATDSANEEEGGAKDVRYVGASIPSHSFRRLQNFIGDSPDASGGEGDGQSAGRRMKVVRMRQKPPEEAESTEF